jgi:hypothetical protein
MASPAYRAARTTDSECTEAGQGLLGSGLVVFWADLSPTICHSAFRKPRGPHTQIGMHIGTPNGVVVSRPDHVDVEGLVDAWAPLVTVRVVTRRDVLWIDPLTLSLAVVPHDGRRRSAGVRDARTRMMRNPQPLVVNEGWACEVLVDDTWRRIAVTGVEDIAVVEFNG